MSDLSSTFRRQLSKLLEENKVTQSELASRLDVTNSAVNNWLLGNNMPRMDKIDKIASIFNVPRSILIGDSEKTDTYSRYGLLPVVKRKIPIIGNVHCGKPEFAEEDYLDIVESDIDADYALKAKGDSMIGAAIEENDLVFVKKQPSVKNGELAVILLNDEEAAIKRVYKYDSYISLNAENPAYQPLIFHDGDSGKVEILGRVVAHLHYYKERKQ